MQHKMGRGELLDARGALTERGWATEEVRRYRRAAIGAHPLQKRDRALVDERHSTR